MKKIYNILVAGIASLSLVSCIGNLNTLPLNDYDATSEAAYVSEASYLSGLAYINAYYNFVSQNDAGASDLSFDDAGQSELIRQWLVLNDVPTSSLDIGWGDSYIAPLETHTWNTSDNNAIIAVYTRCMKGIALVNEYLLQTTDEKLAARGHEAFAASIAQYRAEARFHRAMFYYILMDEFGNPPFAKEENIGGELPQQISRKDLFEWLETELLDLVSDASAMPAKGAVAYPRPTKDAAKALLARMYLNAEVYTGTARWADAKTYAKQVIDNGYSLHPNYRELFMLDNGQTCGNDEFIFAVEYDVAKAQSWGGTTTLNNASFDDGMNKAVATHLGITEVDYVSADTWNGYHIDPAFAESNFELKNVKWNGNGLGYDTANSDKRLFLYNAGADAENYSRTVSTSGWRCWKWAYTYSDGTLFKRGGDESADWKLSSADFAIFRLPEMYYIYAESDARLNGGSTSDATAIGYIKALRTRAGLSAPGSSMTVEYILKDKAAEYLWEGQRRQDEIRLGIFDSDPNRSIYPILESDRSANPNLKQNPGY
ncbi:MAG: RagB/SusD family nutrient uptake outer membrane protein [Bacteroidales bacterium]|nr:RagB/SusD family nutrient uptake outer membrane protein [Bacteroidales bacterium]